MANSAFFINYKYIYKLYYTFVINIAQDYNNKTLKPPKNHIKMDQ